jgi:hypothetical protein
MSGVCDGSRLIVGVGAGVATEFLDRSFVRLIMTCQRLSIVLVAGSSTVDNNTKDGKVLILPALFAF